MVFVNLVNLGLVDCELGSDDVSVLARFLAPSLFADASFFRFLEDFLFQFLSKSGDPS